MEIIREVKRKGVIVIPLDIREGIQLKEKDKVSFTIIGNEVIMKKYEKDSDEIIEEFCNVPKLKKHLDAWELKKVIESQHD